MSSHTAPWPRPRSPLPPHRLAKLANALGVSTPVPAVHQPPPFMSPSYTGSPGPTDQFRRSPTPSASSMHSFSTCAPTTSKFLLHIIPPLHLPHESGANDDFELTPPPPNASGYHTQFRRGTLVPVHASYQAQLGAIAKEYALPSTSGLFLYLVTSPQAQNSHQSPTPGIELHDDDLDEPGPRLSEEIWKHLWSRVFKAEQRDENLLLPSRSPTPNMYGAGTSVAASTPSLQQDSNSQPLRPFLSISGSETAQSHSISYPFSPSTPSSSYDLRSNPKSAGLSSSSPSLSDPDTPDTSAGSHTFDLPKRADSLDLPGLHSSSLIPILAKVEFDIDRRKATWYEPWLRSRRKNHAKRAESRTEHKSNLVVDVNDKGTGSSDGAEGKEGGKKAPIELLTGRKQTASPVSLLIPAEDKRELTSSPEGLEQEEGDAESAGYEQLSDADDDAGSDIDELEDRTGQELEPAVYEQPSDNVGPHDDLDEQAEDDEDDQDGFEEDATARVASFAGGKDPLAEVFGNDEETWTEIRDSQPRDSKRETNSNVVELALTSADLSVLSSSDGFYDEPIAAREEEEVKNLLEQMSRPRLSVSIPSSPPNTQKRSSSPSQTSAKKHVPPPLILQPIASSSLGDLAVPTESSPLPGSAGSAHLAYLQRSSPSSIEEREDKAGDVHGGDMIRGAEDDEDRDYARVRSPAESEKSERRGGAVFDDLDLGLEPSEDYDDELDSNDPHDRRRSQYLMRAQLDEIEKTMAQLSPRMLKVDLEDDHSFSLHSAALSPHGSQRHSLSPGGMRNSEVFPPTSRLPQHHEYGSPPGHPPNRDSDLKEKSWPAVPFSALNHSGNPLSPTELNADLPPSPPRLAVNGITTSAPKSYTPTVRMSNELSAESESRRRELEEMQGSYPTHTPSVSRNSSAPVDSPVIPLSPDPFGRYSSAHDLGGGSSRQSSTYWEAPPSRGPLESLEEDEEPPVQTHRSNGSVATSRFSADSLYGDEPEVKPTNRSTLSAVKTIKKLWRKSNNKEASTTQAGRASPQLVPPRPERPSQEQLELPPGGNIPTTPTFGRFSPQLVPPSRPSQEQQLGPPSQQLSVPFGNRPPQPIMAAQMQNGRKESGLDRLHFDQESPYPIRGPPPIRYARPPSPPSAPPPEKEKLGVRKSILKSWKSTTGSNSQQNPPLPEPRTSSERSNASGTTRPRRPSVLNFGSSRSSAISPPPDIPPSPQIPEHFNHSRSTTPASQSSPPRPRASFASSHGSQDSRPSFDTSQFEIVSPRMNSTLSYPYHGLDHD